MREKVFYSLTILELLRKKMIRQEVAKHNLYFGQPQILKFIYQNEGCNQNDLAIHLRVSPASIATSTKRLEKSGFLAKTLDDNNLRQKKLSLTEKGKKAHEDLETFFYTLDATIMQNVNREEIVAMEKILDKMIYNLSGKLPKEIDIAELFEEKMEEVKKDEKAN